ncbi:MAG: hypothetical protein K6E94_05235 [Elusimicrobiaceae bacterium]|nr:hypothetical protein [Elusimicrobiaceae bacterium]
MLEKTFDIRHYEFNAKHELTPWGIQNFFQEAACLDADELGFGFKALTPQHIAWVLTKLQIQILDSLQWCDTVKIKTWVVSASKITSRRDFIMYDKNGKELAKGTTEWVIIDLLSRRLIRIPQFILDGHPVTAEQGALEQNFVRVPSFEGKTPVNTCKIYTRLEDIDINNHVNNQHFTSWALQATPPENLEKLHVSDLLVYFKKEIPLGDILTVNCYKTDEENTFWYTLINQEGKEASAVFARFK